MKPLRTDLLSSTCYILKLDTGDFGKILHVLSFYIFKLQQLTKTGLLESANKMDPNKRITE